MNDTAQHSADALAKHVTRAIFALKVPSPDGSQHYQAGWDDGLEAAMDAARDALLAVLPAPTDQIAEVCICGHTEQQHFEDVCITEITGCECGDYLTPDAAREVIDRWQKAAMGKTVDRAAVLLEAADELGRMDYDTDSNDYGYDTYRDAWNGGVMDGAALLRRLAGEAHRCGNCEGIDPTSCLANPAREAQQDPTQDGEEQPRRGDWFEQWLVTQRDRHGWQGTNDRAIWDALDTVVGLYRLYADAAVARSGQPETDPEA